MASRSSTQPNHHDGPGPHRQRAPMWVLRVEHLLEMKERMQPHQILKAQGLLEIWIAEMFTVFVSHQWLGFNHPDLNGEQLNVLQNALKKMISKRLNMQRDPISAFFGGKLNTEQLNGIQKWYVWLDYFCVPQLLEGQHDGLAEDQLMYIDSIFTYIDLCTVFVALVPQALHTETKETCDMHSWLQRGWCRAELWCHYLSTRSKLPIILVKNPDSARFTSHLWHRYPVHTGDFALERDRATCSQVIQRALMEHVAIARQSNKTAWRLHLSLFEELTGLAKKVRSVDDFVSDFNFPNLQRHKGLGPVACAALSGDDDLLRRVVTGKASVHARVPGMAETLHQADFSPLHLALWFRSHDLRVLETLLELRADPNNSTMNMYPPLGLCRTVEAVDLLVRHGAGVNFQGKFFVQYGPANCVAAFSSPPEVMARLLELRADVRGGKGGLNASPLHLVAYSGESKNDLRNAQLLVENRADINQVVEPEGLPRMLELLGRSYSSCRSETGLAVRLWSQISTTPLGWCAILDNQDILVFLLSLRADPHVHGNTGLRPIDMARSETIRAILKDPSPYIYLLEHKSDLITEIL